MPITIAAWNVNSVRTRLPHLLQFLSEDKPGIVLLQELKCVEEQFPRMEVEDLGYNIAIHERRLASDPVLAFMKAVGVDLSESTLATGKISFTR